MGSGGRKSPSGVQGQSPWWGLGGAKPPPPGTGTGAEPPEVEPVLMIIKTFWLIFFLIKSYIA